METDKRLEPILITGGSGFLGRHLAEDLGRRGCEVVQFDIREDSPPAGRPFFKGDVCNLAEVLDAVRSHGINSIIHTAAVIPPHTDRRPYQGVRVNLAGTCHVLEAARLFSLKRVTFLSSGAVYGSAAKPCAEDDPIAYPPGYGLYGSEKAACELMGLKYAELFRFEFAAARVAAVYGPGGTADHYLNVLVQSALQGRPVRLEQGGDHCFEFVHVADVADGIRRIHTAAELKHRIYNVGTGKNHSLAQLAAMIKSCLPEADLQIGPGLLPHMNQRGPFDIARLSRLGYRPRYDLEQGLRKYIEGIP